MQQSRTEKATTLALSGVWIALKSGVRGILEGIAAIPRSRQFSLEVPCNLMISVSNVSMRYGAKVSVEDVSTASRRGSAMASPPNGSGKSTFMKLLTGELDPQKGTVSGRANLAY